MQTFLPYPNFAVSMLTLDDKRLGKQRVEAKQILNALAGSQDVAKPDPPLSWLSPLIKPSKGWSKHPATRMWRGYEYALMLYHDCTIRAWMRRGFQNNMPLFWPDVSKIPLDQIEMPHWLGDEDFHAAHRSNLMYKNQHHYGFTWGWTDPVRLPYIWPKGKGEK